MSRRCGGLGIIVCLCGGDFCICDNYGEYECEGCDACYVHDDRDDENPGPDEGAVSFGNGYMGDLSKWCYWSTDYPDEGSVGPFDTHLEAMAHARASGAYVS